MQAEKTGAVAGAGSFRCAGCGFAITLQERDAIPPCPHCQTGEFARASIFEEQHAADPWGRAETERPAWLAEAREALVAEGCYLAFEDDERVRVVQLQEGWTRIGRSMAAHIEFDDPTVSRRHALVHCEKSAARVLDDRSLNGVCVNGERVDWLELSDGDRVTVGRYQLHYVHVASTAAQAPAEQLSAAG